MPQKIAATIEQVKNDIEIRFYIDGKQFAFRTTKEGLQQLLHEEGTYVGNMVF